MRADLVVIDSQVLDDPPRFVQAQEPVFIQALTPEGSVEALYECVLHGLTRLDKLILTDWVERLPSEYGVLRINLGQRFRYHIIYRLKTEAIEIVAFGHNSQRDAYCDRL